MNLRSNTIHFLLVRHWLQANFSYEAEVLVPMNVGYTSEHCLHFPSGFLLMSQTHRLWNWKGQRQMISEFNHKLLYKG